MQATAKNADHLELDYKSAAEREHRNRLHSLKF